MKNNIQDYECKKNAAKRDWTADLKIFSLTLSQLSYRGELFTYFQLTVLT